MISKAIRATAYTLLLSSWLGQPQLLGQTQQQQTAELSGVIKDATGARVPRVTVTATHPSTQFTRQTQTNESGFYVIGSLPIGDYVLSAELSGFRKFVQSGITLGGGQRKVVDIVLEVGEVSNQIEVTAAAPLVDRVDATLGENLEQKTIQSLPLNGRDFTALLKLQAGAVSGGAGAYPTVSTTVAPGDYVSLSQNGAHDSWTSTKYTMDGVDIGNFRQGNIVANSVSVESIAEVAVGTSNYSAALGGATAGKVNFISKTGTNNLHGSLFEFYRGTRFQANEFLANAAGRKLQDFSRHQFGGSLGGPVIKNKLFFFFVYEGIRIDRPSSYQMNTLTSAFKQTLAPALRVYLDPVPEPTKLNSIDPRVGTVVITGRNQNHNDVLMPRINWNLGEHHQIFGRWNRTRQNQTDSAAGQNGGFGQWPYHQGIDQDNREVSWNFVLGPTTTNNFSYGYQFLYLEIGRFKGFPAPACPACGEINTPYFSGAEIPSFHSIANEMTGHFVADNFRKVYKNHQFSLGFEARRGISGAPEQDFPAYTFLSLDDLARNSPVSAVNNDGFAPTAFGPGIVHDGAFYVQDDWKLNPRLTVNLGLRWDLQGPTYNSDKPAGHRPLSKLATTGKLFNCKICTPFNLYIPPDVYAPVNDKYFTRVGEKIRNGSYDNVGPRVGVAYDLLGDGKTVLRAGYAKVYNLMAMNFSSGEGLEVNGLPGLTINRGDAPNLSFPVPDFSIGKGPILKAFTFVNPDLKTGWSKQWNLSLQRALPGDSMLQLAYVGNRTQNMSIFSPTLQINPFIPDPSNPAGGKRIDPCCAAVNMRRAYPELTDYHSLEVTYKRVVARGLTFNAYYTWGHSLNEYGENQTGGFFFRKPDVTYPDGPGSQFLITERSASFGDVRHNGLTYFVWELPLGQHPVARGWQLSGIFNARTGIPFAVSSGKQNRYRGTSRPDQVPGVSLYTGNVGHDQPYLNKAAFAIPAADPQLPGAVQLGNAEYEAIKGPGFWNTDLSFLRDISISERQHLQLRAEFFNLFNHANWGGGLNTNLSSATFGMMTSPVNSSRQIQFGIRYSF